MGDPAKKIGKIDIAEMTRIYDEVCGEEKNATFGEHIDHLRLKVSLNSITLVDIYEEICGEAKIDARKHPKSPVGFDAQALIKAYEETCGEHIKYLADPMTMRPSFFWRDIPESTVELDAIELP